MAEIDAPAIQRDIGIFTVEAHPVPLQGCALKCGYLVFIIAENQVDMVPPFFPERSEGGKSGHVAHKKQVRATFLLCSAESQQQVGGVVVNIGEQGNKHGFQRVFFMMNTGESRTGSCKGSPHAEVVMAAGDKYQITWPSGTVSKKTASLFSLIYPQN